MNSVIVLLGAPGSGKGTQSKLLSDNYNIPILCMGDICRSHIKNNTELGLKMKNYIDNGNLVPDDLIIDIFNIAIQSLHYNKGVIIDGYPRSKGQATQFDLFLKQQKLNSIFLNLHVDENNLINRLLARKRADDTIDIIKNRLAVYEKDTFPILEFFKSRIINIDSNSKEQEIYHTLKSKINNTIQPVI